MTSEQGSVLGADVKDAHAHYRRCLDAWLLLLEKAIGEHHAERACTDGDRWASALEHRARCEAYLFACEQIEKAVGAGAATIESRERIVRGWKR